MKRFLAGVLATGIILTSFALPAKVSAITYDQLITQQMLYQSAPFADMQKNIVDKMNKVENLKKKGASTEKIMAAQAEVDAACKVYNDATTKAYNPLTYYGVYPMSVPDYDRLAYTNLHDYKLSVLHETNLIRKNDLEVFCTQGVASNTLWLMNECKAELDAMEIKAKENPIYLPQVDELKRIYTAYQNEYLVEMNVANSAVANFNNSVDTFPSAEDRDHSNAYSYLTP